MAESFGEGTESSRYFCHTCRLQITPVMPDFVCPNCSLGFLEKTEESEGHQHFEDNRSAVCIMRERLEDLSNLLQQRNVPEEQLSSSSDRHPTAREVVQSIIADLPSGIGRSTVDEEQGDTAILFPDDCPEVSLWIRQIIIPFIELLLHYMRDTGIPPMGKDKIDKIPMVYITEEQNCNGLQCTICYEHFQNKELARQLPCEHVFHQNCIVPWLEFHHGTCPICRRILSGNSSDDQHTVNNHQRMRLATEASTSSTNPSTSTTSSNTLSTTFNSQTSSQSSDDDDVEQGND